jgi:GNAT superfamily N-acetyltransferase
MSTHPTQIVDLRSGAKAPIGAVLHDGVSAEQLLAAEKDWKVARYQIVFELIKKGRPATEFPQHWRWDWSKKAPQLRLLATRTFGIECETKWQGLMMTTTVAHVAHIGEDKGKPLVYIKYLESAPWNLKNFADKPRFGGIGLRLIEAAILLSIEEGFFGRIGLHSLPNPATEGFYQKLGFVRLGIDKAVENLPYYELTRQAATKFLEEAKP